MRNPKNKKNVKNGPKIQKSQKLSKTHFFFKIHFFWKFLFFAKIKMLSSQFSNIRSTRFNQSSTVQPVSEIRKSLKSQKITFFQQKKIEEKKAVKNFSILLVVQYQEDAIGPELSSPARFRIQSGQPERDRAVLVVVTERFFSFIILDCKLIDIPIIVTFQYQ